VEYGRNGHNCYYPIELLEIVDRSSSYGVEEEDETRKMVIDEHKEAETYVGVWSEPLKWTM